MTHSLKRSEALTDVQRARLDALYRIGKNCAHLQRIHLLGVTTVIGFLTPTKQGGWRNIAMTPTIPARESLFC